MTKNCIKCLCNDCRRADSCWGDYGISETDMDRYEIHRQSDACKYYREVKRYKRCPYMTKGCEAREEIDDG